MIIINQAKLWKLFARAVLFSMKKATTYTNAWATVVGTTVKKQFALKVSFCYKVFFDYLTNCYRIKFITSKPFKLIFKMSTNSGGTHFI